jgi:membrane protease subunit HflC
MKKSSLIAIAVIVLIGGITLYSSVFTVHQVTQALVLQFGNPIRVEREPGLKFKLPFIQDVTYYDRRILDLDPEPQEVILADQKRVNVDAFARYRIINPLEFRKSAGTDANFRQVFGNRLNAAVRAEIGRILLGDMLTEKRAVIMNEITQQMKESAAEFGIEVVDVRIGRTDLPEATAAAVYNRMRSDRVAHAAELRAKGEQEKLRITSDADRERTFILAKANRDAQILRGEGEAEKNRILANAYGRDRKFFNFYQSLETLTIGMESEEKIPMYLSPDSEFLSFLKELQGGGR